MSTTASRRRKPYAGSRFSDPDWTNPPGDPPPGFPPLADDEPDEPGFHQPADPPADQPTTPARPTRSTSSAPSSSGGDAAGFVLGLFGTVLFLQYLHGGVPQVRKWLAAKFLNRDGTQLPAANGRTLPMPAGGDGGPQYGTGRNGQPAPLDRGPGAIPNPDRITSPSAKDPQGRPY